MTVRRFILELAMLVPISTLWAEEVHLSIEETSGTPRKAAFVCTGIPFESGDLKSADVRLTSFLGREIPAYIRPLTYWPDGSIKWLRIQTQISLMAKEIKSLILKSGRPADSVSWPWKEKTSEDVLRVSNGVLIIEFARAGMEFIRSLRAHDKSVIGADGKAQMSLVTTATGPVSTDHENWLREADPDAISITSSGVIEDLHVEEKTPFRYVVRCAGGIVSEDGERKCSFILRYFLFRGSARVKLEWSLIWECDPRKNFMRQCVMRFPAALEGAVVQISRNGPSPKIMTAEEVSIVATRLDALMHQINRSTAKPVEVTYWHDAQEDRTMIGVGAEQAGSLELRMPDFRFAIAGERFVQRYPKEITVSDLDVAYSLWPASTNQILDLRHFNDEELKDEVKPASTLTGHPAGLAMTERIWLDFSSDAEGEKLKAQAESLLVLKAKPSYYMDSGVFGPFYPRNAGLFPKYESATDIALEWLMGSPAEFKWYGLLNDGGALTYYNRSTTQNTISASSTWNCRSSSGWSLDANHESWQMLLHWLRTGNSSYIQYFERLLNHSADAGTVHLETERSMPINSSGLPAVGASRRPAAVPWGQPSSGLAHGVLSRIFWHLLSGDLRSLDLVADNLRFILADKNPSPKNVVEMTLGYELFDGIIKNNPSFLTERSKRLTRLRRRALARNWKYCAAAASSYLTLEKDYFNNPTRMLEKASEVVHSASPEKMNAVARSAFAEGLLHYAGAWAEDSVESKFAQETILRIAELEMKAAGENRSFQGRSVAFAHAIIQRPAYVVWVKAQLSEMFEQDRLDLLSLPGSPKTTLNKRISHQELWRRLSLHPNLSAHQTPSLYGRLLGRMPWFLKVIEADAKLEKIKSVKTRLVVTATPLADGVRIAWKGQIGWDFTGIELHRREGKEGEFSAIETTHDRKESGSYFDTSIVAGRPYQYLLIIRNRAGKAVPYGEPINVMPLTWVRRINCGGPEVTTPDGRVWEADKERITGSGIWTSRTPIQKTGELQEVYKTERWAKQTLTYTFAAKPGRYKVILHLAETNRSASVSGKRVYELLWNDKKLAGPVDVFRASGKNTAWQLEKILDLKKTPGKLVLERIRGIGPAIKGIEVLGLD
jgi:hypothetical protein